MNSHSWGRSGNEVVSLPAPVTSNSGAVCGTSSIRSRRTVRSRVFRLGRGDAVALVGQACALTGSERTRIQNVANRFGKPVSVVGSRAKGTPHPESDWDYVIPGINSRNKSRVRTSLPAGDVTLGPPRARSDIFDSELVDGELFITFCPE